MNKAINFVASQLLWLTSVYGAANRMAWLGPAFFVLFAAWQLQPSRRASSDLRLMLIALPLGVLVDSTMAASGLARYASPGPLPWLAPLWILALWMGFALSFNHSAAYLLRRPTLAVAFGVIGGPLSYWIAQNAWGAIEFAQPVWPGLLVLGFMWGSAMALLSIACRRYAAPANLLQTVET